MGSGWSAKIPGIGFLKRVEAVDSKIHAKAAPGGSGVSLSKTTILPGRDRPSRVPDPSLFDREAPQIRQFCLVLKTQVSNQAARRGGTAGRMAEVRQECRY
jgi:hypothetical protein